MLQDFRLDDGQVSTLSRQGMLAFLLPLSASLQERQPLLFARSFTLWGVRLHSRSAYCLQVYRPHRAYLVPPAIHLRSV